MTDVATHCPYCALQCGIRVASSPAGMAISGNLAFPVNKGALCVKGWSAAEPIRHPDRLQTPLVRNAEGRLEPASWDEALELIARRFSEIRSYTPQARNDPNRMIPPRSPLASRWPNAHNLTPASIGCFSVV